MNRHFLRGILLLPILINVPYISSGSDTLFYNVSVNYYKDLSDTYGGGGALYSNFVAGKSWYGAEISFSHFQAQPLYVLKIPIEELGATLEIPFDELCTMYLGSFSGMLRPVCNQWVIADLFLGLCYGKASYLCFKGVDYSYSLVNQKFTYLLKDYQLIRRSHFGYQVGLNISYFPIRNIGIQFSSRIQDLSNGGTFFLVGGGLCFKF